MASVTEEDGSEEDAHDDIEEAEPSVSIAHPIDDSDDDEENEGDQPVLIRRHFLEH